MKIIIIGLLFFSSLAFADTKAVLLRSTSHVEFSPVPGMRILTVDSDGKVEYQSPDLSRAGDTTGVLLAQLSPKALNNIKAQIASLNPWSPLTDTNPDGPQCMDVPSVNMTANQNSNEIRFYASESCHSFYMEDGGGYGLVELMKGLENLAY
ncbi:MAG: hypothetical protein ACXWC9_08500 [Pseudobdellovibrionaceae bacterium]